MQSIGERLEEARKRRGISIREASESTKIRGDFLLNFENNQFEIGLPDIYVRGFLRNYAGFLKVDPEKLVTDFTATQLGEPKSNRKDSRELFGRMELPDRPRPSVENNNTPASPTAPRRRAEDGSDPARAAGESRSAELSNTFKIGAMIVAGVVALLVIISLAMYIVRAATGPDDPADNPAASNPAAATDTFTLVALETVHVKVTQRADGKVLFEGFLSRGEQKPIAKQGAAQVEYDVGSNLQIELNGKRHTMTQPGPGRNTVL